MKNDVIAILVLSAFAVTVVAVLRAISFFIRFTRETYFITEKMTHAVNARNYRRWRDELRCHYLCLIPFVNGRNVMRLYRKIYRKKVKSDEKSDEKRGDGLYHLLAPSAVCVCLCAVCLCGVSWAWFTASNSSEVATIKSAVYSVNVEISSSDASSGGTVGTTVDEKGIHRVNNLSAGEYSVKITASGSANVGYCKIEFGGETYYTSKIEKGVNFRFSFEALCEGNLTITPEWGSCSATDVLSADGSCSFGTVPDADPGGAVSLPDTTPSNGPSTGQSTTGQSTTPVTDVIPSTDETTSAGNVVSSGDNETDGENGGTDTDIITEPADTDVTDGDTVISDVPVTGDVSTPSTGTEEDGEDGSDSSSATSETTGVTESGTNEDFVD